MEDSFTRDEQGWYSPSMVQRYRQGVIEASQRLQEQSDEFRKQTQFLDWIVD